MMYTRKKLLLIQPRWELSSQLSNFHSNPIFSKKTFSPPLALATLAATAEKYFDTEIWDENTMELVTEANVDIENLAMVALTGYSLHYKRQIEISNYFRNLGILVIIGGTGVSVAHENYTSYFDVIFIGESERTWPKFLSEFAENSHKNLYQEFDFVDIAESPKPFWGNLEKRIKTDYIVAPVQSTRGCPFCCDFCNIWRRFGQKVRCKPVENVIAEIKQLVDLGAENVIFVVDNFAGNVKYAKALLRELIAYNSKLENPIRFFCEISLNIAKDDEFLELLAEANFSSLFMGIESPNMDSLAETNKNQNIHTDIVESCKKILSYGLVIEGSMIVGFDNDGPSIFDQQFDFIQKASIPVLRMHILYAPPKTSLWHRLDSEQRIFSQLETDRTNPFFEEMLTNIIPKQMSRIELFKNYLILIEKLYDWDNFLIRLRNFVLNINYPKFKLAQEHSITQLPDNVIKFLNQFDGNRKDEIEDILVLTFRRVPAKIFEVITIISRQQTEFKNVPRIKEIINKRIIDEKDFGLLCEKKITG